jgi:hypothetical protein
MDETYSCSKRELPMHASDIRSQDSQLALQPEQGVVEAIFIAPVAGADMQTCTQVTVHAGRGLEGDRYFLGAGYYSPRPYPREGGRHVTLIEAEVLDALRLDEGIILAAAESRRNLVTRGIALNTLLDRQFMIGNVRCEGVGLCEPCTYLEELTGQSLLRPLVHRGGLRAKIMTDGIISLGDSVQIAS